MNRDLTIIYYSSNREVPEFETRIRNNILKVCGDLPIISVTQKPIDFGKNIVVGDVGASGFNMFRQVQIACKEATTKFVVSAEADCLYPPDYFTFIPEKDNVCYRNKNLYVMGQYRTYFYKKEEGATHAQVVGREFCLRTLDKLFEGGPNWSIKERNFPKERTHQKKEDVFGSDEIEFYETKNPIVQIKTSHSMRHYTHSDRIPRDELPYWGKGVDFRKKYYDIGFRH
ncbi:MAG: hypothetical protein UV71_C0009G0013 [Microgenomates group bacterium GW2011_GWC1_43_13]|uniref:Glycosyltransferase n=2 Tax=Candidatus Woeseibacteriota TaxID=1752722 RepID=A0A837IBT8_9BACT|nr:MAG: hypothetical protein UV71_C0009G0013 [Microgenomates group bacterium GW2011_GWC1_43_13]KKT32920.1 MAG: hypothetical protein UW20_C0007G0012 [Candidatus Woesebacteria bacterium GW2011_GWB1_44_11]KKT54505.1 MAG: hypothetical protein UW47_C0005G0053 [Candidatus Woesebacteria bacterium GW2011_GWA1_44_23]